MKLRGIGAGGAALLVVAMGAGAAGAFPRGIAVTPGPVVAQATPASALTEDQAVAMLEAEGYVVVETYRTWLGRIVITAEGQAGKREIVLHPFDGQVLRDVIVEPAAVPDAPAGAAAEAVVADPAAPVEEPAGDVAAAAVADMPVIASETAP